MIWPSYLSFLINGFGSKQNHLLPESTYLLQHMGRRVMHLQEFEKVGENAACDLRLLLVEHVSWLIANYS